MKVKCLRLDDMGRGIALVDGKTTFISNLLQDEEALIEIVLSKKNYNEGKIIKLLCESPDRVKPNCPYLNCGCQLKHLDYAKELSYKEEKLQNILEKFAKVNVKVNKIVYDDNMHYRNKITLKVNNQVGYFSNNSNNFIPIKACDLVSPKVNKIIEILNKEDLKDVKEITIKDFDQMMIIIKGNMNLQNLSKYTDTIYMDDKLVQGEAYVTTKLKDLTFKISKDAFFQVNKSLTEKLYDIVVKELDGHKDQTVLDLYCGTGTISLILSKYFKKVIGAEINKEAVTCANINKEMNHIDNVTFICADASKVINDLKADKVVVDPPRSGLTKKGINDILKLKPETIVYISCNPITLARDLNLLKKEYDVVSVTPINMFPRTYHLETITKLKKCIDKNFITTT